MQVQIPPELTRRLRAARLVLVVTGAGVSAESGVPTFRDAGTGLWARYRPEDLATPEAFAHDPDLVWNWYRWRREIVAAVQPNAGHVALAGLASRVARLVLVTQNVDGLHQRAGSRDVVEFHGNITRTVCSRCRREQTPAECGDVCPRCGRCGGLLRPDVVWFGEAIPAAALQAAQHAAETCDVMLSVGTSAQVYPAAGLAEIALARGACVAEFNLDPTPQSSAMHHVIAGPSGKTLRALILALDRL